MKMDSLVDVLKRRNNYIVYDIHNQWSGFMPLHSVGE